MNRAEDWSGLNFNKMFLGNCDFQLQKCRRLSATNISMNRFFCFLFVLQLGNIGTSFVQQKTKACGTSCIQQNNKSMWNILCSVKQQKYVEHPVFSKKTKVCGTSYV